MVRLRRITIRASKNRNVTSHNEAHEEIRQPQRGSKLSACYINGAITSTNPWAALERANHQADAGNRLEKEAPTSMIPSVASQPLTEMMVGGTGNRTTSVDTTSVCANERQHKTRGLRQRDSERSRVRQRAGGEASKGKTQTAVCENAWQSVKNTLQQRGTTQQRQAAIEHGTLGARNAPGPSQARRSKSGCRR